MAYPPELCSISYTSVDNAACLMKHYGMGALMAKLDLRSAYRMVPVHPRDQWLLGISWNAHMYVDRALPFGLRSAPKIFNAVADGLAWAMLCEGISQPIHYLDDFFFCGPPNFGTQLSPLATNWASRWRRKRWRPHQQPLLSWVTKSTL